MNSRDKGQARPKGFKCHICKAIVTTGSSRKHIEVAHSIDAVFVCPNCGVEFVSKDKLQEHIRKHHPNLRLILEANDNPQNTS